MNEKGNRYAISALRNKRAVIGSEIEQLERELRHRRDMLGHVDATLRLLDPSIDTDAIPNKRPVKHINLFRSGELGRMILDAIRRAETETVSTQEIVSFMLKAGGHGEDARKAVASRVRSNLAYLERRGKVTKTGTRQTARWRLA